MTTFAPHGDQRPLIVGVPRDQAAAHLISEGMVTEGLALCRAIHDRYAEAPGRRNPFNEIEYGNHYTRAMSSYGAYLAMCGFRYHGPRGEIGFAPKMQADNFKAAFTVAEGWGSFSQKRKDRTQTNTLELKYGQLELTTLTFEGRGRSARVTHNGEKLAATLKSEKGSLAVSLGNPVTLRAGDRLAVVFE